MSKNNPWELSPSIEEKYTPIILDMIKQIEDNQSEEKLKFNLSSEQLNPYTLSTLMKNLGYKEGTIDTNGWQQDFWIPFTKQNCKKLCISGTGIIFELFLCDDDDNNELDYQYAKPMIPRSYY